MHEGPRNGFEGWTSHHPSSVSFQRVNEPLQVSSTPCLSRALYNNDFCQICSSFRIAAGISHMATMQTEEPKRGMTQWRCKVKKESVEQDQQESLLTQANTNHFLCLNIKEPVLIQRALFTGLQHWLDGAPPKYPFPWAKAGLVPEAKFWCSYSHIMKAEGEGARVGLNQFWMFSESFHVSHRSFIVGVVKTQSSHEPRGRMIQTYMYPLIQELEPFAPPSSCN